MEKPGLTSCSTVGLTLAYSNPNPQLDGLLERLSGPSPARGPETGPSALNAPDEQPPTAYPPAPPRSIGKRLSPTDRDTLTIAFNAGVSQARLATEYGISIRSIKRLVQGASNRPQATANRLTTDQRSDLVHAYRTTSSTQHELARKYGISLSTVKRLLRHHTTDE
jgi:DNA invertase Pin-like site-specific DNA recombinase